MNQEILPGSTVSKGYTPWFRSRANRNGDNLLYLWKLFTSLHSMDPVAWFLQIPPNPQRMNSTGTVSTLSSIFRHSSVRPSEPDGTPRQTPSRSIRPSESDETPRRTPSRSVTWSTHVEVRRQPSRSVTWSTHVEVFIVPARECNDRDPHDTPSLSSQASTTTVASPSPARTTH